MLRFEKVVLFARRPARKRNRIARSLGGEGNRIDRSFGQEGNKNNHKYKGKGMKFPSFCIVNLLRAFSLIFFL